MSRCCWCPDALFCFFFLFFSPLRCLPLYFLLFFFSFSSVLFLLMLPALNVHRDVENLHRFAKEVHKQKTSICVFMCVCVCEEINKQTKKAKHSFFFFLVTGRVAVMRRIWTGASVKTKKKNSVFNERTQAKLMRKKKNVWSASATSLLGSRCLDLNSCIFPSLLLLWVRRIG